MKAVPTMSAWKEFGWNKSRRRWALASRLPDKFQKLLEDVLKGSSVSPADRLSLAQAGLESDAAQSASATFLLRS